MSLSRGNKKIELTVPYSLFGLSLTSVQNKSAFTAVSTMDNTEISVIPREVITKEMLEKPTLVPKFYETLSRVIFDFSFS